MPRKKTESDEAQQPTAEDVEAKAQTMRVLFHEGNGREDFKPWEDLSPEKQQRWLDEAAAAPAE